ncbi:hypothetical protein, partial [Endozoicomonas sp. ONNA2]|uniref:hypothetical protein n=1 Tax=Endozoicomonas sp. ONNA2 TaxID=2828741 RepID=UPI00214853C9
DCGGASEYVEVIYRQFLNHFLSLRKYFHAPWAFMNASKSWHKPRSGTTGLFTEVKNLLTWNDNNQ